MVLRTNDEGSVGIAKGTRCGWHTFLLLLPFTLYPLPYDAAAEEKGSSGSC